MGIVRNFLVYIFITALLIGCGQARYITKEYDGVPKTTISLPNGEYEIFNNSKVNRLMIRTSHLIFGGEATAKSYKAALNRYFKEKLMRRNCVFDNGTQIYGKWWEFSYKCN
ncbi:MAG: hypothetical protein HQL69_07295 [Magnetococcales bacterium]|nr:hypothetical protein [Magnetococcales bacterium]